MAQAAKPEEPGKTEDPLKHVTIYKDDAEETERLFGDSTSWARKFRAMKDVIKRERLVEKVRRQILGGLETVADEVARRITPVADASPPADETTDERAGV